mmetsp:Transcript_10654/g.12443  ORF Transcript_10654/g.12443 Transcript_10654/m.12443 type:complete len:221 (+) Transcript_10654:1188-1850(+)
MLVRTKGTSTQTLVQDSPTGEQLEVLAAELELRNLVRMLGELPVRPAPTPRQLRTTPVLPQVQEVRLGLPDSRAFPDIIPPLPLRKLRLPGLAPVLLHQITNKIQQLFLQLRQCHTLPCSHPGGSGSTVRFTSTLLTLSIINKPIGTPCISSSWLDQDSMVPTPTEVLVNHRVRMGKGNTPVQVVRTLVLVRHLLLLPVVQASRLRSLVHRLLRAKPPLP